MSSTMWGENPTILACGHLAEPMAGFGVQDGVKVRECWRCKSWQPIVLIAPDLDFEPGGGETA